jgi:TPP-dependent pyruvate/acetoin dehydrogenase alpha subunit
MNSKVHGYNIFHVRECYKFAKQWALEHGPLCIEVKTYRYHGHSMSDPGVTYRSKEEIAEIRKNRDPINYVRSVILDNKAATEDQLTVFRVNFLKKTSKLKKTLEEKSKRLLRRRELILSLT